MRKTIFCLLLVLTLSMFGQVLKRACEWAGIPFLTMTLLRDVLLLVTFVWTLKSLPLMKSVRVNSTLILFTVLFSLYLFASAFEDRFILGIYYWRLYLLPILFFVAASIAFEKMDREGMRSLLRALVVLNLLMLITAFLLYSVILFLPAQRPLIFGSGFVPVAWFVSGAGGNLMRMGLPMAGPNNLGVYFGLMAFLFLSMTMLNWNAQSKKVIYPSLVALNVVGLVATFSRSSMLMLVVATAALFLAIPALRTGKWVSRGVIAGFALIFALASGLALVELASEGFVTRWIELNLKLQDPSVAGHLQSLKDAYQNFEEYYLYGYPRGTVGPRAFLFSVGSRFNVENSLLSVVYDFGLFGAALFFLGYALMFSTGYVSRVQLAVIGGAFASIQFLPYIFDPDVISLFMFVYLLVGHLDRLGYLGRSPVVDALPSNNKDHRPVAKLGRLVSGAR